MLIQQYEPMWANFALGFAVTRRQGGAGPMMLDADGAQVRGDRRHRPGAAGPKPTYTVTSRAPAAAHPRDLLRPATPFSLHGEGDFTGTVHMYKGGYEVKGDFISPDAGYNDYRFQDFHAAHRAGCRRASTSRAPTPGSTAARPTSPTRSRRSAVPDRRADAALGRALPRRRPDDLHRLPRDARPAAGRTRHRPHHADWTLGPVRRAHRRRRDDGDDAAGHVRRRRAWCRPTPPTRRARRAEELGPFSPHIALGPLPIAGQVDLRRSTPRRCASRRASFATRRDLRGLRGPHRLGPGLAAAVPRDQHQLAGERPLPGRHHDRCSRDAHAAGAVDGVGEFDGVLLGALGNPARRRARSRAARCAAWNVTWGDVEGEAVIENAYATVTEGRRHERALRGWTSTAGSRSAIPRRDGGEEIDARIRVTEWPLVDCRTAFELYDYPVSARSAARFTSTGKYEEPFGFGAHHPRSRRRLRRAVRQRRDQPALRRRRRAARRPRGAEGRGHHHRRGVRRLGRRLLVQRRRPAAGRRRPRPHVFPGAAGAHRLRRLQRHRQRHLRGARATTSRSACPISSSARKASAR